MKKIVIIFLMMVLLSSVIFAEVTRKVVAEYPDGSTKEIIYYDDGKEIAKEIFDKKGNIKKVGKIPNGIVKEYYESWELESQTNFKEGKREGIREVYYESGKLESETNFKEDKREGIRKVYYESGKLQQETNYKNDKLEGLHFQYYENGKIKEETNFKNDKQEGIYKGCYESGRLKDEANFKNDKLEWGKSYYESGELEHEINLVGGKGIEKYYYKNSVLRQEGNLKDSELEGLVKSYYESGELKAEAKYKNGELEGIYKVYYESGKLKSKYNYKDGKMQGIGEDYYEDGKLEAKVFECSECNEIFSTGKEIKKVKDKIYCNNCYVKQFSKLYDKILEIFISNGGIPLSFTASFELNNGKSMSVEDFKKEKTGRGILYSLSTMGGDVYIEIIQETDYLFWIERRTGVMSFGPTKYLYEINLKTGIMSPKGTMK